MVCDWNDEMPRSLTPGKPSPYDLYRMTQHNIDFSPHLCLPAAFQAGQIHLEMIDHHLVSRALAQMEFTNSAEVYRVDQFVQNFSQTTSDLFL